MVNLKLKIWKIIDPQPFGTRVPQKWKTVPKLKKKKNC